MNWAHYLIQVNVYLIMFYGFYKLLLDRETYFHLNRIYLVLSGLLSLAVPFLRFEWLTHQPVSKPLYVGVDQFSSLITTVQMTGTPAEAFNWGNLLVSLYIGGILVFLTRFIYRLWITRRLIRQPQKGMAFSFLNHKVIDAGMPQPDTIDWHEETHIRQKHSLDILFFESLTIFLWFNPVIYAFKRAIKNIHEFLADEAAADFHGDKSSYSLLLLSQSFGTVPSTLTNRFFTRSLIKKRIFMLHKERSKKMAVLKYGLFVPLFALTLVLSSATIRKNEQLIEVAENIPLNAVGQVLNTTIKSPLRMVELVLPQTDEATAAKVPIQITQRLAANESLPSIKVTDIATGNKLTAEADNKVYSAFTMEQNASYPGGMSQFYAYLGKTIHYPEEALANGKSGIVYLSFTVEKNGRLSDIKAVEKVPVGYGFEEEAIRVVGLSRPWNPGLINGRPVRVSFNMPIRFSLPEEKPLPSISITASPKMVEGDVYVINEVSPRGAASKAHTSMQTRDIMRHFNTISQNNLLVVIDDRITDQAELERQEPGDVESISVLKAEKALALYGPKAIHGAIVIQTKNPKVQ